MVNKFWSEAIDKIHNARGENFRFITFRCIVRIRFTDGSPYGFATLTKILLFEEVESKSVFITIDPCRFVKISFSSILLYVSRCKGL